MSLKQWADKGWLKSHKTSTKEISDLLRIVERDLKDAVGSISSDWQFGIAYNAGLNFALFCFTHQVTNRKRLYSTIALFKRCL